MINFRYHVVSLTAVFLALTIGLIVGTSALNGPLSDSLEHNVSSLTKQNDQYRDQVDQLNAEVSQKEQFANEAAPYMLGSKLTGRRVVVVSMPGSSQNVDAMVADLKLAGAKVTGKVEIEDSFVKPSSNETLLDLASHSLGSTPITGLPANSDGVETSSALLAAMLLDRQPPVPADTVTTVLSAYKSARFITVDGDVKNPAEAIVLLPPPPYTDQDASAENAYLVTMIDQFDKAGPIVVGAAGAGGQGNVVGAITGDPTLSKSVSTVDNVNTPQGRIAATLALTEQLVYSRTGHYGLAASATSLLPPLPS